MRGVKFYIIPGKKVSPGRESDRATTLCKLWREA
jgi:hypothetical protein